jgi:predicted PurR-regulated permease PerM
MALGAIGGFAAFGLMGVVIGPVLLSLSLVFFAMYKARANPVPPDSPSTEVQGSDGRGGTD